MSYVAGYAVIDRVAFSYGVATVMGDGSRYPTWYFRFTRWGAERKARQLAKARGVWVVD